MQYCELLKIDTGYNRINIRSTYPKEVNYFTDLLISYSDENNLKHTQVYRKQYWTLYSFVFTKGVGYEIEERKIYINDILYWLFTVARDRGWEPFNESGTFIRYSEIPE